MLTKVTIDAMVGLVVHDPILPPTDLLRLESLDLDLQVWSGTFDIIVPVDAVGELVSKVRPLDVPSVPIKITIRYQACNDQTCMLPRTETIVLDARLDIIDIPTIGRHTGHGQREGNYDGTNHLRRLFIRQVRSHPLGFLRFVGKSIGLELASRARQRR